MSQQTGTAVIAIDGPGGAGKGTISRLVAQDLGWHLLDSGALYRLTALAALRRGIAMTDEAALEPVARELDVTFISEGEHTRIMLEGEDVSADIRNEHVGGCASQVAAIGSVREALLARQRGQSARAGGRWSRYGHRGFSGGSSQDISDRQCRGARPKTT